MMSLEGILLFTLLAGLGLFLFGMHLMEDSLKTIAGSSFKSFLRKQTGKVHKAVFSGAVVTAILQSSSLVTLLVMSLTGAGIIGLKNGIGMILGANLGTTSTGWLVSIIGFELEIGKVILPFLAIGGLGTAIFKNYRLLGLSKLLLGFSFLFLGIDYMKQGFASLTATIDPTIFQEQPAAILLIFGIILAAVLHSSSASMMIYLSSLSAGIISIEQAAFLAIGSDLGTTATGLAGTIGANKIKKQTGWAQFYINVISASIAIISAPALLYFIKNTLNIENSLFQLVAFHSLFNLLGIAVIMPFIGPFTRFISRIIGKKDESISQFINLTNPSETQASLDAFLAELSIFLDASILLNRSIFNYDNASDKEIIANYHKIKRYENELIKYNYQILKNPLTEKEVQCLNYLSESIRYTVLSAKDLKDVQHNIEELKDPDDNKITLFYEKIKQEQDFLYSNINTIKINIELSSSEDIYELKFKNKKDFSTNNSQIIALLKDFDAAELDFSSHSNAIREIHNSNEYLLEAIQFFKLAMEARKN
jgi:phosphate:Na+ symporter